MTADYPVTRRTTCRLCGSPHIRLAFPLADVPIVSPNVGHKGLEKIAAPLDNWVCDDCGLIQLIHVVDPALIYRDYLYRTAISKGLAEHFNGLADSVVQRAELRLGELVVEFGSNDGTLLDFFRRAGMTVQGVDPASAIAAEATARGIPTVDAFFEPELARSIRADKGAARAVVSNNCMANIDDLDSILAAVEILLADDGVFVFETQSALAVFEHFLLDVIYHEHISCFSVRPVSEALPRHGLEIIDAEPIATKGGSLRFWIQKKGGPRARAARVDAMIAEEKEKGLYDAAKLAQFGDRVIELRAQVKAEVAAAKAKGGKVAAFGTSVGCAALIHQLELQQDLDFLVDDTPFKDSLSGPGYCLPVHKGTELAGLAPSLVILLAWRYAHLIVPRQSDYLKAGGRIIVPLPQMRAVDEPEG